MWNVILIEKIKYWGFIITFVWNFIVLLHLKNIEKIELKKIRNIFLLICLLCGLVSFADNDAYILNCMLVYELWISSLLKLIFAYSREIWY